MAQITKKVFCSKKMAPCAPECANWVLEKGTCKAKNLEGDQLIDAPEQKGNVNPLHQFIESSTLLEIITDRGIRRDYNGYVESLADSREAIQLYQLVTSNNFVTLVDSLHLNAADVRGVKDAIIRNGVHAGFVALFRTVKEKLARSPENTNYKVLTDRNVLVTEDVETLGITDCASIIRVFNDFTYFKKDSSSPSLVFKATLFNPGENAIKARNTLQPGKQFFFKAFPVGTVRVGGKDLEYPTWGLQTEIPMYTELLKLVKYNITPNILCKLATSANVSGFEKFLSDTNMLKEAKDSTFIDRINQGELDVPADTVWDNVSLICTHKGGIEIMKIFHTLEPEARRQVMFQMIYNFYVFDILQISQGDLHGGNLLINILDEPIELCYLVGDRQFHFQTRHLVKFFDLDRGMIGKTTQLKINKNQNFLINQVNNRLRAPDSWLNKRDGVTGIYNKNFEFINLVTHESHGLLTQSADRTRFRFVYPGQAVDEPFNRFMANSMPGATSQETIRSTYAELLKIPEQKAEADRIFGKSEPYGVEKQIMDMKWCDYFDYIKDKDERLGHILKSSKQVKNNHLWIPDTVVLPKIQMLFLPYFEPLLRDPIHFNVTQKIVYTINGMV